MSDLFTVKLGIVHNSLIEAYKHSVVYGPKDSIDEGKYRDLALQLNQMENDYNAKMAAIESMEDTGISLKDFDKVYKAAYKEMSAVTNNTKRKDDIFSDMDDVNAQFGTNLNADLNTTTTNIDDMEIDEVISTVDPLTKQPITHPVRNRHCKHIYDRNTMEAQLKVNSIIRCPIVGCSNKVKVLMSDLVEDRELKRKMILLLRSSEVELEDSD